MVGVGFFRLILAEAGLEGENSSRRSAIRPLGLLDLREELRLFGDLDLLCDRCRRGERDFRNDLDRRERLEE